MDMEEVGWMLFCLLAIAMLFIVSECSDQRNLARDRAAIIQAYEDGRCESGKSCVIVKRVEYRSGE